MPDKVLQCKDCPDTFIFTEKDQAFFTQQGFSEPKRCKPCRELKKARNAQQEDQVRQKEAFQNMNDHVQENRGSKKEKGHW